MKRLLVGAATVFMAVAAHVDEPAIRTVTVTHSTIDGIGAERGAYRPEAYTQRGNGEFPESGVEIGRPKGKTQGRLPFIQRFDIKEDN